MKHLQEDQQISREIASEFGEGWIPQRPTIEIKAPLAYPGDYVEFENPRAKSIENRQQHGKVVHLVTNWIAPDNDDGYIHSYHVEPSGKSYKCIVFELRKLNDQ